MYVYTLRSAALFAACLAATAASAVNFKASETITANTSGSGLQVSTTPIALNFNLTIGQSTTQDVFKISTPENSVNMDDLVAQPISVTFHFTSPSVQTGTVNGSTVGDSSVLGFYQNGAISWNGSKTVDFGSAGLLTITLNDTTFAGGYFGLTDCSTTVTGKFKLAAPGPLATAVPEPASWVMMVGGFGALGAALRRRSAKVSFA